MSVFKKIPDRYIPLLFVLFFVVIAILDGIFVTVAIKTQPGTVTEKPYEQGLAYNKTLEDSARQQALGWTGRIAYDGGRLVFTLLDQNGQPIGDATARARVTRAVQQGYDFDLDLKAEGGGVYSAPMTAPLPGQWSVRVFAAARGQTFQKSDGVMVQP